MKRILKIVSVLLIFTMISASLPHSGIMADIGNEQTQEPWNLARSCPVTVSGSADGTDPRTTVDGNLSTRWSSNYANNAWIYVDFGSRKQVSKVVIEWYSASSYGKQFQLQISDDAINWTDVYNETNGPSSKFEVEINAIGRYLKMQGIEKSGTYGFSIREFEAWGIDGPPDTAPVFDNLTDKTTVNGAELDFLVSAIPYENDVLSYGVNNLPDGAVFNPATQIFQWTPGRSQVGKYNVEFTVENNRGDITKKTIAITVNINLANDITPPWWTEDAKLIVSNVKDDSLTLSWSIADDDDTGVATYDIYIGAEKYLSVDNMTTSYTIGNLTPGKSYSLTVRAVDAAGNTSAAISADIKTLDDFESTFPQRMGFSRTFPNLYEDWANGMLAGNGKMGVIVFGNPLNDTIIYNDRDLNIAAKAATPTRTFNQVSPADVSSIRDMLANEQWSLANSRIRETLNWKDGGDRDRHPAYKMTIDIPAAGAVSDYSRVTDYSTGEILVNWHDNRGDWERRTFVSRKDDVIVQYLTKPTGGTLTCNLSISVDPGMHLGPANFNLSFQNITNTDYMNMRAKYAPDSYGTPGYEGVTRIVVNGGQKVVEGDVLRITGADSVMLLTRTKRYYDNCEQEWTKEEIKASLDHLPTDYETLLAGQIETHKEIYDRVKIDLGSSAEDRLRTNEELLAIQKRTSTPVPALYERMFDAGRYHFLSSSYDEAPPDLLGVWTGDAIVGWQGFYHLDANLNLQVAGGNIGNMAEAMEGYFHLTEAWEKDWQTNATKLLGARGMLVGGNSPGKQGGLLTGGLQYVTGGVPWLLYPFWEHYMVTGDKTFLKERYYPLIKQQGFFYEDFLTKIDPQTGKYIFAGSISPENQPPGVSQNVVNNSVYDISGAKFVLSSLIKTCEILGTDKTDDLENVKNWQRMLEMLPPYLTNADGAIKEWAWPNLNENYGHRHSSHMMPVWPYREITPEKEPALYEAALTTLAKKDAGGYEGGPGHGLLHSALVAASLKNGQAVENKLQDMARNDFYYTSLATAHYRNFGVFCTDVANTFPTVLMETLVTSDTGVIELLPAVLPSLRTGSISGVKTRTRVTVEDLTFDLDQDVVRSTLKSDIDQDIELILRKGMQNVVTDAAVAESTLPNKMACVVTLKAGVSTEIRIDLKGEPRENLALNKPADASSTAMGYSVSNAVDGDVETAWVSQANNADWYAVDLGAMYELSDITLKWGDFYSLYYKVQISTDGINWKDSYQAYKNNAGEDNIPLKRITRYIRVQSIYSSGNSGISLRELEVFGKGALNIALNKPSASRTVATQDNSSHTSVLAFDGNLSSRWIGTETDDEWIWVDLGRNFDIYQVVLRWQNSGGKEYLIQVSDDGNEWKDVAHRNDIAQGATDIVSFEQDVSGRFVRMRGIKRSSPQGWGYSLWEFEVYGVPAKGIDGRDIALNRAVYQSGAANYNNTGHLVTDGIDKDDDDASINYPIITSQHNDSPSGQSVEYAFDGSAATKTNVHHIQTWIQYQFPGGNKYAVSKYSITTADDQPNRDPREWTLYGVTDNDRLEVVDTRTFTFPSTRYNTVEFETSQNITKEYKAFRLSITRNNGNTEGPNDGRTQLAELALFDAAGNNLISRYEQTFISSWQSKTDGNEWLYIDLGGESQIDKIKLSWSDADYAKSYEILVSEDAKNWTKMYSSDRGSAYEEILFDDVITATYIKLNMTACNGALYELFEWNVYGDNDVTVTPKPLPAPESDGRQMLTGGNWKLQRASEVHTTGEVLSAPYDDTDWIVATVPGTTLVSYLNNGALPDPNFGNQQLMISESFFNTDFWYRDTIVIPSEKQGEKIWLNFNNINWKADVYFNGQNIGRIEGAFIRGKFDITDLVKYGEENDIAVYIYINDNPGATKVKTLTTLGGGNGGVLGYDNPTIHASIGWNWMPTIRGRDTGIWGDVFLSYSGSVQLLDPWIETHLPNLPDTSTASLTYRTAVSNITNQEITATIKGRILPGDGGASAVQSYSQVVTVPAKSVVPVTISMTLENPNLWWPNRYGDQYLYTNESTVEIDGKVSDTKTFRFGVRELTWTNTGILKIMVNGVRIYCSGGNWGMDEAMLRFTTYEQYDIAVRLHKEQNYVMIRNWVGQTGNEYFYDACDKYGILVFDDFWLANPGDGPNPTDEDMFMENAVDKIKVVRKHPSVAFYCGRNEGNPPASLDAKMRAAVAEYDSSRYYVSNSASGQLSGFGPYPVQGPSYYFQNANGNFHSERGSPNFPEIESVRKMLPEENLWPINEMWAFHDFVGGDSTQQYPQYLAQMALYPEYDGIESFVKIAQFVNMENHKALFAGPSMVKGSGMLKWTSQSAWPSLLFGTYDYYFNTNAGYFGSKAGNQPVNAFYDTYNKRIVVVNNSGKDYKELRLDVKSYDLNGRQINAQAVTFDLMNDEVKLSPVSTPITAVMTDTNVNFIKIKVMDNNGNVIGENFDWVTFASGRSFKDIQKLGDIALATSYSIEQKGTTYFAHAAVTNYTDTPALMIRIKTLTDVSGEQVLPAFYSDNYFSLMPGETKNVTIEFDEKYLLGEKPNLFVEGWNIIPAEFGQQAPELFVSDLKFKLNGKYITTIDAGAVSVEISVGSSEKKTIEIYPVIAIYDKTGQLIDAAGGVQSIELPGDEFVVVESPKISVPEDCDTEEYIVKGFVWDGTVIPMKPDIMLGGWIPPVLEPINLALNRPVTVSGTADSTDPNTTVDGDMNTRWSSNYADNAWIYADLETIKHIAKVKIDWYSANSFGASYIIQAADSDPGIASSWKNVITVAGTYPQDEISLDVDARYIRMQGVRRGGSAQYGYSIREFEIWSN